MKSLRLNGMRADDPVLRLVAVLVQLRIRHDRPARDQIAQTTLIISSSWRARVRTAVEQNNTQLEQQASVLAADFGLREALASNDRGTILSVLANHATRVGARR